MRLVNESTHVREKCKTCEKIDVKFNRRAKEEERIKRWTKDGNKRASIDKAQEIIDELNMDIADLYEDLRSKRTQLR
jgi:hypothetical protein